MRTVRAAVLCLAPCGLVACGLGITGSLAEGTPDVEDAASSPAAQPSSPAPDAGGDAAPSCPDSACGLKASPGWSIVTFTDPSTSCPAGFISQDVVENPVAPAAACTCAACNVTARPACAGGTVNTKYDYSSGCGSTSNALVANASGNCATVNWSIGDHELFPAPPVSGATTCTSASVPNKGAVTVDARRVCVPPACVDACTDGGAFKTCLMAAGDQACPAEAPDKHLVGTDFDVTCGACGCTGVPAATCTGTWSFYSDTACATQVKTLAPGVCTLTQGLSVNSYKWTPTPIGVTCTTTAPAAVPSLTGPSTVCCK